VELIPGGRGIEVGKSNIYDYVRKYSEYRMVRSQQKALDELRLGLFDVIPSTALEGEPVLTLSYALFHCNSLSL